MAGAPRNGGVLIRANGLVRLQRKNLCVDAIQSAMKRALEWNDKLLAGQVSFMRALAKQEGISQRYIARTIKLVFLAPDVIEAILQGNVPVKLSLEKLRNGFPLDWSTQRQMLGFLI